MSFTTPSDDECDALERITMRFMIVCFVATPVIFLLMILL